MGHFSFNMVLEMIVQTMLTTNRKRITMIYTHTDICIVIIYWTYSVGVNKIVHDVLQE